MVTDQKDSRQETQEQDINNFVEKFIESYKQFETNAQYDKRIHSEENDGVCCKLYKTIKYK